MEKRDSIQTAFGDAWGTPSVAGEGMNGIGGGLDVGSGAQGVINSPFDKAVVPTPSGQCTPVADFGGEPPYVAALKDGPGKDTTVAPWDITSSRNTIDRR